MLTKTICQLGFLRYANNNAIGTLPEYDKSKANADRQNKRK